MVREVVDAAGCGIFAEPGNADSLQEAILSLAQDSARSRDMGLAGRAYIELHFDRAILAEKLTDLLEEMVGDL